MKTAKRLLMLLLVVVSFCSAMCISASAYKISSEETDFYNGGNHYYIYYGSDSDKASIYYVGTNKNNQYKSVKVAQVRLVWGGWYDEDNSYPEQVDGDFGPDTKTAIINYQSRYGLVADGFIGETTWKAMLYTTSLSYSTSLKTLLTGNAYL